LKMFLFGCFTLLCLVDIVLISLQLLGPADGSAHGISFYGPKSTAVRFSSDTYVSLYTCFDCSL
uniref:Secreted protein n=1 Tax=Gongylonema pulchrum TaxID=637853 RepID=A0A183DFF3_9BILA